MSDLFLAYTDIKTSYSETKMPLNAIINILAHDGMKALKRFSSATRDKISSDS